MSSKRERSQSKRDFVASKLKENPAMKQSEMEAESGDEEDIGPFEDPYGDDLEDEEVVYQDEDSDKEDEEGMAEFEEEEEEDKAPKAVWRPGVDGMEDEEQLDYDPMAYDMFHKTTVEWPCLSFDIMQDQMGANRKKYPHTVYVVAGTQADRADRNRIFVMKWSKLHRTNKDGLDPEDDDDDNEEEDDAADDEDAHLDFRVIAHEGGVNRIRAMKQLPYVVATWADTGKVHMWDVKEHFDRLDTVGAPPNPKTPPLFTFTGHADEGFAMDFNPHVMGRFVSGDCKKYIYLWQPTEGGWAVDDTPFSEHKKSVEDLQWKKAGEGVGEVFASASVDKSIRFWDVRDQKKRSAQKIEKAHSSDVNVLSWHPTDGKLLLSGSDDGSFKVWDVRNLEAGAMANFTWHKGAVTSVDWHPSDEACLAVSSEDNTLSIWDMSVEEDTDTKHTRPAGAEHYPPQLLFLHQGQKELKEIKWHPQIPGVMISTASDGFNVFKTSNI